MVLNLILKALPQIFKSRPQSRFKYPAVPKMDSKQVARELFLAYKVIKKGHHTENTRFVGRKTNEKTASRAKASSQLYKNAKHDLTM